jgi:hypothetical protein
MILRPTKVKNKCAFVWNDLEVKRVRGRGKGVFAKKDLPAGTAIPIWGVEVKEWEENDYEASHGWARRIAPRQKLDGHPSVFPHKGIGSFGLSIAMMLNEPSKGRPNCLFLEDSVVVQTDVHRTEELTVWYGDEYDREFHGYKLKNPDAEWETEQDFEIDTVKVYKKYKKMLDDCFKNTVVVSSSDEEEKEDDLVLLMTRNAQGGFGQYVKY